MSGESQTEQAEHAFRDGRGHLESGHHDQAVEGFRRAASLFAGIGDRGRQSDALQAAAMVCVTADRADDALALFAEIVGLLGSEDAPEKLAMAQSNLGLLLARQGQLEKAIDCFEESGALFEQAGNRFAAAQQLGNIGTSCRDLDRPDAALDHYHKALGLYRQIGRIEHVADQYTNIAYAWIMKDAPAEAVGWYRKAEELYALTNSEPKLEMTRQNLAVLTANLGDAAR